MSDFNVPGSRPKQNTMKFGKSTVTKAECLARNAPAAYYKRPSQLLNLYEFVVLSLSLFDYDHHHIIIVIIFVPFRELRDPRAPTTTTTNNNNNNDNNNDDTDSSNNDNN